MSNLKHLSLDELRAQKYLAGKRIDYHNGCIGGMKEKIKWIDHYIAEKLKTPYDLPEGFRPQTIILDHALVGDVPDHRLTRLSNGIQKRHLGILVAKKSLWQRIKDHFKSIPADAWGGLPASISRDRVKDLKK